MSSVFCKACNKSHPLTSGHAAPAPLTAAELAPTTSRAQADREYIARLMRDGATLEEATSAIYQRDAAAQLAKERVRRMSTAGGAISVQSNGETFTVPALQHPDTVSDERSTWTLDFQELVAKISREEAMDGNGNYRDGWSWARVNSEAFTRLNAAVAKALPSR